MNDNRMIVVGTDVQTFMGTKDGKPSYTIEVYGYERELDRDEIIEAAMLDKDAVIIEINQHLGVDSSDRVLRHRLPPRIKAASSKPFIARLDGYFSSNGASRLNASDGSHYTKRRMVYEGMEFDVLVNGDIEDLHPSTSYSLVPCGEQMLGPQGHLACNFTVGDVTTVVWVGMDAIHRIMRHESRKRARFDGKTYSTMGEPFNEDLTWQANRDRD